MGPIGMQEMVIIFVVALVLFGPKKLPELGRTLGKAITEFRRASSELKATFESHLSDLEKEHESLKQVTQSYTNEIYNHYDSPSYDAGAYSAEPSHDSTASHPSTVSASAPQGAESATAETTTAGVEEHAAPPSVNGTVARS